VWVPRDGSTPQVFDWDNPSDEILANIHDQSVNHSYTNVQDAMANPWAMDFGTASDYGFDHHSEIPRNRGWLFAVRAPWEPSGWTVTGIGVDHNLISDPDGSDVDTELRQIAANNPNVIVVLSDGTRLN